MNQKELSAIAEFGLNIAMSINENYLNNDLLLQYYTEEQLEWLAMSIYSESELRDITKESVLKNRQYTIDLLSGIIINDRQRYKDDLYEGTGVLLV